MLVVVCAWCERFLGTKQTGGSGAISHGMCRACMARQQWDDPPTLVFPPDRAHLLPVFREILRGLPEIPVVIDRRAGERRQGPQRQDDVERRSEERRRVPPPLLD